jgi:hypothetical protein
MKLSKFVSRGQASVLKRCLRGEERAYFEQLVESLADRIKEMPALRRQDGNGTEAIAYLHYFHLSGDWYLTELDQRSLNAFGGVSLWPGETEMGYVSVKGLVANGVELDLYFTPKPLSQCIAV